MQRDAEPLILGASQENKIVLNSILVLLKIKCPSGISYIAFKDSNSAIKSHVWSEKKNFGKHQYI